jgi:hypothetical protein
VCSLYKNLYSGFVQFCIFRNEHLHFFSFKCLFIEDLQGYSAPYSATSIYIYSDYNNRFERVLLADKLFMILFSF